MIRSPKCLLALVPFLAAGVMAQEAVPPGTTIIRSGTNPVGVVFRVWAPDATGVAVRGSFNDWGETPMVREETGGHWVATVGAARAGDEYKYSLRWEGNAQGTDQLDPRSLMIRTRGGKTNSVIYDHQAFDWGTNKATPQIAPGDRVMYELHVGTFHDPDGRDGRPGTFDDAAGRLPYLRRLGVNVIALMPVAEFFTATSWGYNPQYPFAVEESYGGPDGLKRFVREAHRLGMAVQLDVVHNHYGGLGEGTELLGFGGANSYFYATNSARGRTKWGPRPNYADPNVRSFISDSIDMFLEDYGIAGLRWDSPRNIMGFDDGSSSFSDVGDPGTVIPEGKSLLEEINASVRAGAAGRWSVSEDSDLLVPRAYGTYDDPFLAGLQVDDASGSFDGHWQTSFHNIITPQVAAAAPSVGTINTKVSDWSEPPGWRVIFTDNHDKAGDLNIGTTDGGSSLVGWRLANRMDPANQGATNPAQIPVTNSIANPTVRKKVLLNAVLTLTAPGVPMLLMGQEFGATGSFSDTRRMDWREASGQSAVWRAHRDLVALRTQLPVLRTTDLLPGRNSHAGEAVLTYWRTNGATEADHVFVALNFSGQAASVALTNLPSGGNWYARVHTDWTIYGGSTEPGAGAVSNGESLELPALSAVVLAKEPPSAGQFSGGSGGIPEGWISLFGVEGAEEDPDGDGLTNLREYQLGLDPLEEDAVTVTYDGVARGMRSTGEGPVAQHIRFFREGVSPPRPSTFGFLSNSVPGPFFSSPAGVYGRFLFNLEDYSSGHSYFTATTNLAVVDAGRTNWAAYHGVSDFGSDDDGDGFGNLQEFARGSDPTRVNLPIVTIAGSHNGWSTTSDPMVFAGGSTWERGVLGRAGRAEEFKFTAGGWELGNWGDSVPVDGIGDPNGGNIQIGFGGGNGVYRFSFDEESLAYRVDHDPTDAEGDGIQDAWISHHGLAGTAGAAGADPDGDGWSNLAEFFRYTNANGTFMNPAASDGEMSPKRMTVTGSAAPLPVWSPAAANMTWSDSRMRWEWTGTFSQARTVEFKFSQATNGTDWSGGATWGAGAGEAAGSLSRWGASNAVVQVEAGTRYRFSFNDLTGSFSVAAFPPSAEWWEQSGLGGEAPPNGGDIRWSEDTDRDGVSHRMEYALGGNPRGHDHGGLVTAAVTNTGGGSRLVMRWIERTNGGVGVTALVSTNLASAGWTEVASTASADINGVPPGHRRMEASVPVGGGSKFLKLRVTGP